MLLLAQAHGWILALSFVVGAVVRGLKPDVPIPVNVPPRARPLVALALGVFGGAVLMVFEVVPGLAWPRALVGGFLAGGLAVVGHETLVESLRAGRDFGTPKAPAPEPSDPPPPVTIPGGRTDT